MKKITALLLMVAMVLTLSVSAFAGFVSSPSANLAPDVITFETQTEGCDATLKVTSYADRGTLTDEQISIIEKAYKQIAGTESSASLAEALKKIAEAKGLNTEDLSVSDLFFISYENCEIHENDGHKGFKITLKADTVSNLAGLLYFDGETWKTVEILEYDAENGTVTIFVEELGCFAFVVDKYNTPVTGDTSNAVIWMVVALCAVVSATLVCTLPKKRLS